MEARDLHARLFEQGPCVLHRQVGLFGSVFLFAILAMALSVRNFWRDANKAIKVNSSLSALWQAAKDAGRLRYLDGGGVGCYGPDEKPTDNRRHYHHMTFYGFLLCFAATSVGTLYHYLLGYEAPYPWYDLPVVLGTLGGVGLIIGPIGLMVFGLASSQFAMSRLATGQRRYAIWPGYRSDCSVQSAGIRIRKRLSATRKRPNG